MLYWILKRIVVGPLLHLLFRPWVEGIEHVPEKGGAIFASNHLSFSDSIFLPLVIERRLTFRNTPSALSGLIAQAKLPVRRYLNRRKAAKARREHAAGG